MKKRIKINEESTVPLLGAVWAMSLCAMVLVASEFMPVSLLTPIASELAITEGHAGQSISISGLFALVTSLFITSIIGHTDRRSVLLFFTALMGVSGIMVAFAPDSNILMIGRAVLGICIGGFGLCQLQQLCVLYLKKLYQGIGYFKCWECVGNYSCCTLGKFSWWDYWLERCILLYCSNCCYYFHMAI